MKKIILLLLTILINISCASENKHDRNTIKLPDGFKIEIYASNIPNARSMVLSKSGILFVGNAKCRKCLCPYRQ